MKKTILIVEDDIDIRDSLRELLEIEGYSVISAANGQEGLDCLARQSAAKIDLILLDLMMPIKDGLTFRAEQQEHPTWSNIPVVVMSADRNAPQKVANLGVMACLRKPVELDVLLGILNKVPVNE
jgi:CheY-like chemotaxis protein